MPQKTDTSKVNFDLLFKNHPIPMWIYDLKTLAFLEVNDAAVEKYGYKRKTFLSMTLKDIRPEEDVSKLLKDISKKRPALQHSGIWQHKLNIGKVIDVEITSHTIDYNGCKAALVIAQDITERRKVEEEKLVFSTVIENSLNELYVFDIDSLRFRNVNKGARENLGYSINELLQMTPLDLKPEFTKESFEKLIKPLRNKKKDKIEFTTVHRRKDGSLYPVEVHLSINHKEKVFSTIILDITERKRTEKKLRESEENLRIILESTADGILVVDNKGKVIKTNKLFADLWHIPPAILSSEDDNVLLNFVLNQLIDPEQFLNKVRQLYNSTDENLDTLFFKDGRIYERFSTPLLMRNKVIGRVWSFRNITERKLAEEAMRKKDEHYKTIIENIFKFIPEGVLVFTETMNLLKQNKAFGDIVQKYAPALGYTVEELTQKIIEQLSSEISAGEKTEIRIPKNS